MSSFSVGGLSRVLSSETDLMYMDYIDITDAYLGDVIEDIVSKYYPYIDLSLHYGELLEYISRHLVRGLISSNPSPIKYERRLSYIVSRYDKSIVSSVISYLVSRFINEEYELISEK